MPDRLLVTCEHAGNRVPARYAHLFAGADRILASHRGLDRGALGVARRLARNLGAPLRACTVSRLLVEPNRSLHHPRLFSEFTSGLPAAEKEEILRLYYLPYRQEVQEWIHRWIRSGGRVLHLSVHSFTPVMRGRVRRTDIGLLYDPARAAERRFCALWRRGILEAGPRLRVRRNYPYRGVADGFIPHLRRLFPEAAYTGLEVEINQKRLAGPARCVRTLTAALEEGFRAATASTDL